jgi:hypothetical protein
MKEVKAVSSFDHYGQRHTGDQWTVSDSHAAALEKKGLVEVVGDGPTDENPSTAAGEKSSASPADPVSSRSTSRASKRGGRRATTEPSS